MAINVNTVMDALGVALDGVTKLRVYDYEASSGATPAGMVLLPERLTYDHTKGRGTDHALFTVVVIVGKHSDRAARDLLAEFCDGTAAATVSVKAAVETVANARVESVDFTTVMWGGVPYLAAEFTVAYID